MVKKKTQDQALVLGIDTGGTYTDAVLMDYNTHLILAACKSLTTKHDFSIGIENVIQEIQLDDPGSIQLVSISTTLATNAIAEGKGKRVGLFLIGYDPELIDSFNLGERFSTPDYYYFSGGHNLHGQEKDDLDLESILQKTSHIKDQVDAIAISSYFSPRNPQHEIRAEKAVASVCDLPIVLGHQLSSSLGSVERATTAALNASLISVLQEFIIAVRRAMEHRGINAPLMVVRGDGTLMSAEFAARTPVETIHSGPAASAIGGRFLSGLDEALVLDVGGTTTDLALIKEGKVEISEKGAVVAGYQTAVQAANLLSIGLGGDSYIQSDRSEQLVVGPERVVPLSYFSSQHPGVRERLSSLAKQSWPNPVPDEMEYWFLQREVKAETKYSNREKEVLALLQSGPKPATAILKSLGLLDLNQLDVSSLWRQEILGKSGLTPTDILHVDGRYNPWDKDAASAALQILSNYLDVTPEILQENVWNQVRDLSLKAVLRFLTDLDIPDPANPQHKLIHWFLTNCQEADHDQLQAGIKLKVPLIGIGAPADVMLSAIARVLQTDLILPEHFQMANAAGAVAGSVMVMEKILVYPRLSEGNLDVLAYYLQGREIREEIEELEEALEKAKSVAGENARRAALRSGAENPQLEVTVLQDGIDSYLVQAKAIGKPSLKN